MKPIRTAFAVLLAALLCLSACVRKDKVIPRDTMADIYADLFISDQWLRDQAGTAFMDADTTRFYEPIFRKYGYTTLDFRNSANHYLQDSRRFARILQRASVKLEEHAKYLERLSSDIETVRAEIRRLMDATPVPMAFNDSAFFARAAGFTIDLRQDERGAWMPFVPAPVRDTIPVPDTVVRVTIKPSPETL